MRQEKQKRRKIQRKVLDEDDNSLSRDLLYEKGQVSSLPYVLADDNYEAIIVIQDDVSDHPAVGVNGTRSVIVEGECHRCGSNRLRIDVKEGPGNARFVSCPVCNKNDNDGQYTDWFTLPSKEDNNE